MSHQKKFLLTLLALNLAQHLVICYLFLFDYVMFVSAIEAKLMKLTLSALKFSSFLVLLRSIEVFVPPDLKQIGLLMTHKKSITTLVWHHGFSDITTAGQSISLWTSVNLLC